MDWIGLNWIGSNFVLKNLDWIGSEVLSASLFFRKRLRLVFSFVKMHFWFSSQLVTHRAILFNFVVLTIRFSCWRLEQLFRLVSLVSFSSDIFALPAINPQIGPVPSPLFAKDSSCQVAG